MIKDIFLKISHVRRFCYYSVNSKVVYQETMQGTSLHYEKEKHVRHFPRISRQL